MRNLMIINDKYPNSINEFCDFIGIPCEAMGGMFFDKYLDYFDERGLFIGITCDADGLFWIPEICSVPLEVCNSRESAQERAIEECFKMLEEMIEFEIK